MYRRMGGAVAKPRGAAQTDQELTCVRTTLRGPATSLRVKMKLGFVGTGAITESVVRGLVKAGNDLEVIALSPRNAGVAARLAALHHRIRIARDNQSVVDSSDIVFLAVRPQVASDVVAGLEFHPGQRVVSFVAGLQL